MLRRQRQIRAQVQKLVDGGLFGLALWLAHWLRASSDKGIEPFSAFLLYFLVIIPVAPAILQSQGFYARPLLASRRQITWQLIRVCSIATIGLILLMFLMKESLARGVFLLFGGTSFLLVLF